MGYLNQRFRDIMEHKSWRYKPLELTGYWVFRPKRGTGYSDPAKGPLLVGLRGWWVHKKGEVLHD